MAAPGSAARSMSRWAVSRSAVGLLLSFACLSLASCRVHWEHVRDGLPWDPAAYEGVEIGHSDRGVVLDLLGPPADVFYTLDHEVFDYEVGGHRGTDLQFLLPTSFIPLFGIVASFRDAIEILFPTTASDPRFNQATSAERVASGLIGFAQSFIPFGSTEDSLSLSGRRIRFDTARIVLDRETLKVISKELHLAAGKGAKESWIRSSFLVE